MSFESGFRLGAERLQWQADRERQAEMDRRSLELHNLQVAELNRRAALEADADSVWKDRATRGLPIPQEGSDLGVNVQLPGYQGAEQRVEGDTRSFPGAKVAPQTVGLKYKASAAANADFDQLRTQASDAARLRDSAGYSAAVSGVKARALQDVKGQAGMLWDQMPDEQRQQLISQMSAHAGIPGQGAWVVGNGKQPAYMHYEDSKGKPYRLADPEIRAIFQAQAMNQHTPGSGDELMRASTENARKVYFEMSKDGRENAQVENQAAYWRDHMDALRSHYGEQARTAKLGTAVRVIDHNTGNIGLVVPSDLKVGPDGVRRPPPGMSFYAEKADTQPAMSFADFTTQYAKAPSGVKGLGDKELTVGELNPQQQLSVYNSIFRSQGPQPPRQGGVPAVPINGGLPNRDKDRTPVPTPSRGLSAAPAYTPPAWANKSGVDLYREWDAAGRPSLQRPLLDSLVDTLQGK